MPLLAVIAFALAFAAVPVVALAQTSVSQWHAELAGDNEVPPSGSSASGMFTATVDEAGETVQWTLTAPDITAVTAAHLHLGAAGTNGPIVLPLFAAPEGSPVDGLDESGTSGVADLIGELEGDFAAFVAALKAGEIYANVHTTTTPSGEIRGQLTSEGAPAAAPNGTPRAGVPSAPATGNAGLASSETTSGSFVLLAVLAAGAVLLGGRLAVTTRR